MEISTVSFGITYCISIPSIVETFNPNCCNLVLIFLPGYFYVFDICQLYPDLSMTSGNILLQASDLGEGYTGIPLDTSFARIFPHLQ